MADIRNKNNFIYPEGNYCARVATDGYYLQFKNIVQRKVNVQNTKTDQL